MKRYMRFLGATLIFLMGVLFVVDPLLWGWDTNIVSRDCSGVVERYHKPAYRGRTDSYLIMQENTSVAVLSYFSHRPNNYDLRQLQGQQVLCTYVEEPSVLGAAKNIKHLQVGERILISLDDARYYEAYRKPGWHHLFIFVFACIGAVSVLRGEGEREYFFKR